MASRDKGRCREGQGAVGTPLQEPSGLKSSPYGAGVVNGRVLGSSGDISGAPGGPEQAQEAPGGADHSHGAASQGEGEGRKL